VAKRLTDEAETRTKEETGKMITKARDQSEEIITKAQKATGKIRQEIEKDIEIKAVNYAVNVLETILGEKAKGALNRAFLDDFIESLKTVDMTHIDSQVSTAEVVTTTALNEQDKAKFQEVIKGNLKRDIQITTATDPSIIGGAVLKFGTLALDGSVKYAISEEAVEQKKFEQGRSMTHLLIQYEGDLSNAEMARHAAIAQYHKGQARVRVAQGLGPLEGKQP